MSDLPVGDPLKPQRPDSGSGAEPLPSELESRLDEVNQESIAEAGSGVDSPPPRPNTDVHGGPPGAKLQSDDEGPQGEGGQNLAGGPGGGGY